MDPTDRYDPDAFDFLGPPFAAPAGGDLLLTLPQEDALSATLDALGRGTALVLIVGDAGSGRTLLVDALADTLLAHGQVVDQIARLGGPGRATLPARLAPLLGIAPGELEARLASLVVTAQVGSPGGPAARASAARSGGNAGSVGAEVIDRDRPDTEDAATEAWDMGQWDTGRRGARPAGSAPRERALTVLVDDAGTWPDADLLLLASMAGLRDGGAPLLHAVLIGDAALERRFAALRDAAAGPGETPGRDAAPGAVSLRIPPLTRDQGEEYLAHRFAAAGGSLERTMSPGAIGELLLRCGGNPGRIDSLADDCLAITARRRRRYVTSAVVRTARETPRARRRLSGPLACMLLGVAGGALATGAGVALVVQGRTRPGPALVDRPGQAAGQGDAELFAGSGRFAAPSPPALPNGPAVPRPFAQEYDARASAPAVPGVVLLPPSAPKARVALRTVPPVLVPDALMVPAAPAVPRIMANAGGAAPLSALPPIVLAPAPVAPRLAAIDPVRVPAVPSLTAAGPATIRTAALLAVPGVAPPVLPPMLPWPVQPGIAAGPQSPPGEATPAGPRVLPGATGSVATAEAPPAAPAHRPALRTSMPFEETTRPPLPRDGTLVTHVTRERDTRTTLLRRIWRANDQAGRALFRSLNPGIDPQGPWPVGTLVTVPHRPAARSDDVVSVVPPRLPLAEHSEARAVRSEPRAAPSETQAARDNPAGQVRSAVPYFCRSILPQNGAEDAYIREACGR